MYSHNNLEELPEDISAASVSSKENENVVGFFGELNPLSNFHQSPFVYNGVEYTCSEQLIQYQKALYFGDKTSADKILNAQTGLDCKKLSKEITNYNHYKWKIEARVRCEEGIKAKFMQNSGIRSYLLNTGTKKIVECCNDKLWGTGIPLYDENCLNPTHWTNQGILGEILEANRTSIHDIMGINQSNKPSFDLLSPTLSTAISTPTPMDTVDTATKN